MGIIALTTPKDCQSCHVPSQTIKRHKSVNVHELVKNKGVPIVQYQGSIKEASALLTSSPSLSYKYLILYHCNYAQILFGILVGFLVKKQDQDQIDLVSCSTYFLTVMVQL